MLGSKLIINADDFGYNSNINAAIVTCFKKNLITSTTIMVNMDGFEEAIRLASVHRLESNIGLHVNLTEGKPLTDLSGTGLTDQNGNFIMQVVFSKPSILISPSTRKKIKTEIKAQYDKLIKSGIYPTHIETHQHVHTLPLLAPIFVEFAEEQKQKLRIVAVYKRKNFFKYAFNVMLNINYKRKKIHFTDRFGNVRYFMNYLNKKEVNHIFEIMVHPAYDNDIIIDFLENTDLEKNLTSLIELYNIKSSNK
jgi:predicted glycoside hydrolase/deacetylase ChbG (UPF0249 family)